MIDYYDKLIIIKYIPKNENKFDSKTILKLLKI